MSDDPTKPDILTLPDYRARLAAYRAVSNLELGSLDGPVTTWDSVNAVIDAYRDAVKAQGVQECRECGEPVNVKVYCVACEDRLAWEARLESGNDYRREANERLENER